MATDAEARGDEREQMAAMLEDEHRRSMEEDAEDAAWGCERCGGTGWVVTCIDDLCRGAGECMHGDGEDVCPECEGRCAS